MSARGGYSLQARLVWLLLGLLAALWTAMTCLSWFDARHEVEEILDSHLAQAASLVVALHAGAPGERGLELPMLHRYAYKTAIQVYRDGQLVLRSAAGPAGPLTGERADFTHGLRTLTLQQRQWRVFAAPGAEPGVQVYVGEEIKSRDAILLAALRSTLWPMLAALPVLLLAVWWAVRRGLAPLRELGQWLAARQPEALARVELPAAPAEMLPVVAALNALFGRIESLLASERRFTADAAHELRTPIAAIRAQAQVAHQAGDTSERQQALQATLQGCDRAARLVEQLLTLARLEAGAQPAGTRVDLPSLVRGVLAEAAPLAVSRRQTLAFDAASHPTQALAVHGDEALLAVLVRNLVDNAIRYSPAGARIEVGLRTEADAVLLEVEDSGPGLAPQHVARLGERFFRVLGTAESGSGLGWSIVRRVAAAGRLAVQVARSPRLGGLQVRVRIPGAAAAIG